jgi:diguanylate cyclase (GGDEF)-like protein
MSARTAQLQQIFREAPEGMALVSLDPGALGAVRFVNSALCRLLDLTGRADAAGRVEAAIEADARSRPSLLELAAGGAASGRLEWRLEGCGGAHRRVEVDLWRVEGATGEEPCAVAQLRDVTELRRLERRLEIQQAVRLVLGETVSAEGAIAALLPALAQAAGFRVAAAWEPEGPDLRCHAVWTSPTDAAEGFARLTRGLALAPGSGLPSRARENAAAAWAPDMGHDATCPRAFLAARERLGAGVAIPIFAAGELLVVVELAGAADAAGEDEIVPVLSGAAIEIGEFLARKRAEQRPRSASELLLVEDNAFVARMVQEMLDGSGDALGLELVHVASLAAARERLLRSRPACVLLDLNLPDADGIAALLDVRRLAAEVPIVVLTGHEDEELAVRAVQEGAQDYLMKRQVNFQEMSRAIRYAMERKRAEQHLLEHTLHDGLTGLPNRALFLDRLRVALARREQTGSELAVLLLNLDRFRVINDSLGHAAGDRVLAEIGARLVRTAGPEATVASFAADEFAVLVGDIDSERSAVAVAERLAAAVAAPFELGDGSVLLTASLGVALAGPRGADAEGLVGEADTAMSEAKALGGESYQIFEQAARARMRERLDLERGLRVAIESGQLRAHYQSIRRLDQPQIVGFEALVRWEHPEWGLVSPGRFMPIAEESGLVVALGRWMLEEACRQLAAWNRRFTDAGLTVNVNLSARQLADPDLVDTVTAAVRGAGVDPGRVYLEVTETGLIEDFDASVERLQALKRLGVHLALDDFGTGYSSLSYLRRLPIDVLKLDRSFVSPLGGDPQTAAIVAAVANMADALGIPVLAEGVETQQQLEAVRQLGYQCAQGFLFERPLPPEEATRLLERECAGGNGAPPPRMEALQA